MDALSRVGKLGPFNMLFSTMSSSSFLAPSLALSALMARKSLGAVLLFAAVFGLRWAFVPPAESSPGLPALRGASAAVPVAMVASPLAASAADEYLNYNMTGEFTPFMIIGYFGLTTFLTAFAFGSYLILTKLKII